MKWWEDAIGGAAMSPRSRNIASPQSGRYADDAGSTAGSQPGGPKLTVVRHLRKQAQNDAQLLINRIALLRQEEAKARKKIQETQLRAQEMLELKKHTVEKLAVKQQREAAAKKKQELVRQRVEKQKRAHAKKMELARKRVAEAKVQEVREVHIMRRKFKAEREQQKREKVAKARKKHEAVKGRDGAVQRAQEAKRRERQARVIEEYERKIEEENARRAATEVIHKVLGSLLVCTFDVEAADRQEAWHQTRVERFERITALAAASSVAMRRPEGKNEQSH